MKNVAVIRVRGLLDVNPKARKAMELLGLTKKHACRIMHWNEHTKGQIHRIKDFVAWGEINETILTKMIEKKELKDSAGFAKQFLSHKKSFKDVGEKPVFNLHPPRGGFPRKGIRQPATRGGALGFHKNINELLEKML
ncbi:MAG: 50S ribosomal protein L30 [Nanoarchaeota archaeon]|nr:50S ribosomal protein L30 [Nanoarchaeota archaeon]